MHESMAATGYWKSIDFESIFRIESIVNVQEELTVMKKVFAVAAVLTILVVTGCQTRDEAIMEDTRRELNRIENLSK